MQNDDKKSDEIVAFFVGKLDTSVWFWQFLTVHQKYSIEYAKSLFQLKKPMYFFVMTLQDWWGLGRGINVILEKCNDKWMLRQSMSFRLETDLSFFQKLDIMQTRLSKDHTDKNDKAWMCWET